MPNPETQETLGIKLRTNKTTAKRKLNDEQYGYQKTGPSPCVREG